MSAAVYNIASLRTSALLLLAVVVHAASAAKWAAQVRSRSGEDAHDIAQGIARDVNLRFDGRVGELFDTFTFSDHDADHHAVEADGTRSSSNSNSGGNVFGGRRYEPGMQHASAAGDRGDDRHPALQANSDVLWHSEQRPLSRMKRGFNDPLFHDQWYLVNRRRRGNDLNITGIWKENITGKGVVISIVDDGVEMDHPDLKDSYSAAGSIDLNSNDQDPSPRYDKGNTNHHGTRCAGEIVAHPNNSVCGVGVSYGAKVSGTRVLDGDVTDSMEASAFGYAPNINDIYSCSWGPDDDGMTLDGPRPLAKRALQHGIVTGRNRLGSLFVVASGNGGRHQDNCNFDGYANSIYTLTIGGISEDHRNPAYNEPCAATMAVSYSSAGGVPLMRAVTTTDLHHKCTKHHTGTSAAAPLVAGLLALVLEVRPCLTWRDTQYLIMMTATKVDSGASWMTNGAFLEHSYEHGFGVLNAWRLVQSAKTWKLVPRMLTYVSSSVVPKNAHLKVANNKTVQSTLTVPTTTSITALEHVVVMVHVSTHRRGALRITLTSPNGTESVLATPRLLDEKGHGLHNWNFSTVRNWGESPEGDWTLTVQETDVMNRHGVFHNWRLTLYGTSEKAEDVQNRRRMIEYACGGNGPDQYEVLACESRNDTEPEDDLPDTADASSQPMSLSVTTIAFVALVTVLTAALCVYAAWACVGRVRRSLKESTHPAVSKAAILTGITVVPNRSHGGNSKKDQRGAYSVLNNIDDSYALGVYDSVTRDSSYSVSRTLSES